MTQSYKGCAELPRPTGHAAIAAFSRADKRHPGRSTPSRTAAQKLGTRNPATRLPRPTGHAAIAAFSRADMRHPERSTPNRTAAQTPGTQPPAHARSNHSRPDTRYRRYHAMPTAARTSTP